MPTNTRPKVVVVTPKLALAVAAFVAPVPPLAIGIVGNTLGNIVPLVIFAALCSWLKAAAPKLDLAVAASVAPVPPLATASVPLETLLAFRFVNPAPLPTNAEAYNLPIILPAPVTIRSFNCAIGHHLLPYNVPNNNHKQKDVHHCTLSLCGYELVLSKQIYQLQKKSQTI